MKKITLFIFIAFFLAGIITIPQGSVHAQDPICTDAAGGVIPCPPTAEIPCGQPGGPACPPTAEIPCGQPGGPACPPPPSEDNGTQKPTATPFPLSAAPTVTPTPEEGYLGQCTQADGDFFKCKEKFICEDGLLVIKVDLYSGDGTVYDFYCIPDENIPQLDLPITIPDPKGKDDNWTGGCPAGAGLDACLDLASDHCGAEGGEISIWYDDDGAGVYCQNQSEASQPAPEATPLPVAASPATGDPTSDDDWDESCSWASCWAYDLTCWSGGGSGYGTEDGSGGVIYHCDMPADTGNTKPPSNWLPWLGLGVGAILIGLLVPAVQKVREAANRMSKTNEHILLNNDNGGTEAGYMKLEDIKGESSSDSPNDDGYQKKSKRHEGD